MSVAAEMKVDRPLSRHLAIGAEIVPEGGVHFRVWAPEPAPEPLLAPSEGTDWDVMWVSEDPRYGGSGMPTWPTEGCWHIQGETAVVLRPKDGNEQSGIAVR